MAKTRPLWQCPRCGRQFANKNQMHGCTDLTVADCLAGKPDNLVKIYRAYEKAVLDLGEVRIHPTRSRIAFIARMTFAGAIIKRDHVEAGMMLPYPSRSPRFHGFIPNGAGGVHYFKLFKPSEVDTEIRQWLREAFLCGMQQLLTPKLSRSVKTAELPKPSRSSAPASTKKVFYLHFKKDEFDARTAVLRKAGHEVQGHWDTQSVAKLGDFLPDVFVISLDRLPSHARGHASWFWSVKKRQSIPIIFAGGEPEKVLVAKHQFPKAFFCSVAEVPSALDRL
jgi:hypothetical protein